MLSADDCAKVFSSINAAHGGSVNKEDFVTAMKSKYEMEDARRNQQSIVYILESKANKEKDRSQRKVCCLHADLCSLIELTTDSRVSSTLRPIFQLIRLEERKRSA